MKIKILLAVFLIPVICNSQTKYQAGLGAGYSFSQTMHLQTGNIGLKFHHYRNYLVDYNQIVNRKTKLSLGVQGQVTLYSGWVEPDKSIPYYHEREHIPIFQGESAEIMLYFKKSFEIYNEGNLAINIYILSGPCFNFNEGNSTHRTFGLRDDNGQSFQIAHIIEKAQKAYIPYLRISGGFEIHKKVGRKYFIGLSPFISWSGFQTE